MSEPSELPIRGRGATFNPANRFESLVADAPPDSDWHLEPEPDPKTEFLPDATRSIIARNESPDVPFNLSINPYRGCEHGCIYCFARPTHEYLGLSAGVDFETKIFYKQNAAALLREALLRTSYSPDVINVSGVTDCYQPIEKKMGLTRACLEVLREFNNPFTVISKNHLVTRDLDILAEMAGRKKAAVYITVTTLDDDLCAIMEPRTSRPKQRLRAVEQLHAAGVPVGVMIAPVIPGLTDSEHPRILEAARDAGARWTGFVPLRLPFAVAPLFEAWLGAHFPDRKDKVLHRIQSMRGGKLNDPRFGERMRGEGPFADQLRQMHRLWSRKLGFNVEDLPLTTEGFRRPGEQMNLFVRPAP